MPASAVAARPAVRGNAARTAATLSVAHRAARDAHSPAAGEESADPELPARLQSQHERGRAAEPAAISELQRVFYPGTTARRACRLDIDPGALVSPVDGTVSQIGRLDGSKLLQAKGHDYTLEALLDGAPEWAQRFTGGAFATLYLAPYNYHRIHMPMAGTLRAAWFVPGKLFSVNAVTAAAVPGLFAKNERVVCVFEDGPRAFAMVLVGALFVGSIATVWHGDVAPRSPHQRADLPLDTSRSPLRAQQGRGDGTIQHGLDGHPVDAA